MRRLQLRLTEGERRGGIAAVVAEAAKDVLGIEIEIARIGPHIARNHALVVKGSDIRVLDRRDEGRLGEAA